MRRDPNKARGHFTYNSGIRWLRWLVIFAAGLLVAVLGAEWVGELVFGWLW